MAKSRWVRRMLVRVPPALLLEGQLELVEVDRQTRLDLLGVRVYHVQVRGVHLLVPLLVEDPHLALQLLHEPAHRERPQELDGQVGHEVGQAQVLIGLFHLLNWSLGC